LISSSHVSNVQFLISLSLFLSSPSSSPIRLNS
jgi:hypothetical protein